MDIYLGVLFWLLKYFVILGASLASVFMLAYPLSGIGFLLLKVFVSVHDKFKPKFNSSGSDKII